MATRRGRTKARDGGSSSGVRSAGSGAAASSRPAASNGRSSAHKASVTGVVNGLRRIVRALHQSHRQAEQRWDVSAAQLLVMQRLAESPTLSVNELADRTYTHQSTVSVVVTRLVGRGLVRRERADDDLRRAVLALTPAGRVLLQRAMTSAQMRLIDALDAMPTTQLRALGTCLERLVEALGVSDEPAGMFFEDGVDSPNGSSSTAAKRRRS